jgi:predicted protein tyrosine phosphatase
MNIKILSEYEIRKLLKKNNNPSDAIISITGKVSDIEELDLFKGTVLRLCFDDNEDPSSGPQTSDVLKIINFAQGNNFNSIIVHCGAGVSRSTAASAIYLIAKGMEPVEAFALVKNIVQVCMPNRLMIRIADVLMPKKFVAKAYNAVFPARALNLPRKFI